MEPFVLRPRTAEPTFSLAIALNGVVTEVYSPAKKVDIYWRWEDEPDTFPQYLGTQSVGFTLSVPFDLQGRAVRLYAVPKTEKGVSSIKRISEAKQTVFYPSFVAILSNVVFDSGTDDVTGDITNNTGTGDIHILRSIDDSDFVEIDVVPPATTSFTDSPVVDGEYIYKLTQDGLAGESASFVVDVDVGTPAAGSPPSALTSDFDGIDVVSLDWTNNGGTGNNVIEKKSSQTGNLWIVEDASVSSSATDYDVSVFPVGVNVLWYFRVSNTSVPGYTNEVTELVPQIT